MKKARNKNLTGDYGGGVKYEQLPGVVARSPRRCEEWRVSSFGKVAKDFVHCNVEYKQGEQR